MGEQIESMVRSVGKMIAGALVAQGIISDSLVEPLIGVAVALATMVWSYVAHRKPAKPE